MYDRFVSLRLPSTPPSARPDAEVVLARVDAELRHDALVVTRHADHYEMRRVGHLTADQVELLPLADERPAERLRRDDTRVVGTVLLRWMEG